MKHVISEMRIVIVGDGIAGRTLYRVLNACGFTVDLFGRHKNTRCGIRPCGFGTSASCIKLVDGLGIPPKEYVLGNADFVTVNGRRIKGDFYFIDKPKLLEAISMDIRYDDPDINLYHLIVDASGIARAYSPSVPRFADKRGTCYQYRVILESQATPSVDLIKGGYIWTIPLGRNEAHVGSGSESLSLAEVKQAASNHVQQMKPSAILCSCYEQITESGPIFPLISSNVISVGESAGLVVPYGGTGILPALESAMILAEQICKSDLEGYERIIRKRFNRLCTVRRILDRKERRRFNLSNLISAYWLLHYQGFNPTLMDLLYISKEIRRANK